MSAAVASSVLERKPVEDKGRIRGSLWVNVLAHLDPKYGGMSAAVPALSSAVRQAGEHAVSVAGFCEAHEQYSPFDTAEVPVHHLPSGHANWLKNSESRRVFGELIQNASGVHIHGLWEQSTLVAARVARKAGKPYIVSAHGMLQPWALNNKRLKKVMYGALIERSRLKQAVCLHALTQAEVQDYRSYGLKNPVAVIPNGVNIPHDVNSTDFLTSFPSLRGKRLVLFLSRLHFKKGLDILCQAWAAIARRQPDAQLVLAGPDFEGTRASIEELVVNLGIRERVTFTGMLNSDLKWSALSAASCFVLPSYSEGLSVSVLEAMGMALPVIITKQCNLPEVEERECGWVINPNVVELTSALKECLASSSSAISGMSAKGRQLVKTRYSWPLVGAQMSELYTWSQGGTTPANVEIQFAGKQ